MPADLWNFALACYARPGVEQVFLRLQDGGADVCLLLCALWLERRQVPCEGAAPGAAARHRRALATPGGAARCANYARLEGGGAADPQQARLREQVKGALELEPDGSCSAGWSNWSEMAGPRTKPWPG